MADAAQADGLSLAELYFGCIDSFAKFVIALSEPNCDVICRDEVRLSQILEEYGRTKLWGDQSKADLPARARGSLDDTLRHDDDLKSLVRGILKRLGMLLQQVIHISRRKYDPGREIDQDSISSVTDSDYSTDNDNESERRKMPKICLYIQQISEQVRSLHEISSLLRRPTVTNKFIRSTNLGLEATTLQDPGTVDLNGAFGIFDNRHILEKVTQWRGLGNTLQDVIFSDEAVAPVSDTLDYPEVQDIRWFCQRLARANTRRREQLQYWKTHPYDPTQMTISANSIADMHVVRGEDSRSQVSTLKPSNSHVSHEGPKTIVSKQSFSTVAISDVHDTGTDVRPRTVYAPTAAGKDRPVSIPRHPKTKDGETAFPCPYCGMKLGDKNMTRQLWKRHVFRDLRPYICTFEHCHNAGKLFSSRHEWQHHEFQIHRREYVCQRCRNRYASRKDMMTHLQGHYGDSIPSEQMDIILDLCDRQVDPSNNHTEPCILCGKQCLLSEWHDHVAAHMEDISIFVLPAPDDDDGETKGSILSGGADVLGSNDDSTSSVSKASSLGFSEAGDHGQIPAEFAKIFADKEPGYASKFSAWKATEEDENIQNDQTVPSPIALSTKWPLDQVLSWLAANGFSKDWQETFKTLDLHGDDFLDLGRARVNFSKMHQVVYPELARECSRSGTGWDQSHQREEGKRMRRLIRSLATDKPHESPTVQQSQGLSKFLPEPGTSWGLPDMIPEVVNAYDLDWWELEPFLKRIYPTVSFKERLDIEDHYLIYVPRPLTSVERDEINEIRKQHRARDNSTAERPTKEAVTTRQTDKIRGDALLEEDRVGRALMMAKDPETTQSEPPSPDSDAKEGQIDPGLKSVIEEFEELKKVPQQGVESAKREHSIERLERMTELIRYGNTLGAELDERSVLMRYDLVQLSQKLLGKSDPFTLRKMDDLAFAYQLHGRWENAGLLYTDILEARMKALGAEHPDTLQSIERLAKALWRQGRTNDAEHMFRRVLQGYEKTSGPDDASTITTVRNLGSFYMDQGRLEDAEAMYKRVLQSTEKVSGPEHVSAATAISNLAKLYMKQERLQDASDLYEWALRIQEKGWGLNNMVTLDTARALGGLYAKQDRFEDAEALFLRALHGQEKELGPEHLSVLYTVIDLGKLYNRQGRFQRAEAMYERAFRGYEKALGPKHKLTQKAAKQLAIIYERQGRQKDAA